MISLKASPTGLIGENLLTDHFLKKSDCNLLESKSVNDVLATINPEVVFQNAGYIATSYDETRDNLFYIANNTVADINILNSCILNSIPNLVLFSSTVALENQLLGENIWTKGKLGYIYSKIESIRLIELANAIIPTDFKYKVAILGNLYGPHSKMLTSNSAIDLVIRKFLNNIKLNNKEITFNCHAGIEKSYTFVKDLNSIFLTNNFFNLPAQKIIIESDEKIKFEDLVQLIAELVKYKGSLKFNLENNNLKSSSNFILNSDTLRLKYGFSSLREGIGSTLEVCLSSQLI